MAYVTGSATGPQDYLDKLEEFLTTDAALVGSGEEWQRVWTSPTDPNEFVLRGTGVAGNDVIFVGFKLFEDALLDNAHIRLYGLTGFDSGAANMSQHTNVTNHVRLFLDFSPFTYWLVASGRRFVAAHRISTVYQAAYGGYILPLVTPDRYPDPLFVGAMADSGGVDNWRSQAGGHTAFTDPASGTAHLLGPDYEWVGFDAYPATETASSYQTYEGTGPGNYWARMSDLFGGGQWAHPITLTGSSGAVTYGQLDGVFHVKGIRQAAETVLSIDGVDHLVLPNAFRSGRKDYFAVRLA